MRFTPVPAGDAAAVARAAHGDEPFVLLLREGCVPHGDAFGGLRASLDESVGVLGGATHDGGLRRFGWMLAPAAFSPLPFELVPVEAPLGEAGVDALVRGPIDAVAPEMILVAPPAAARPAAGRPGRGVRRVVRARPCGGPAGDLPPRSRVPHRRPIATTAAAPPRCAP